ncbi:MAG: hypothetical protein JSS98_16950 [Bacteroidetes bacterium]|nr:hypothetical protein [Bacteroidota bacterium]
MSDLTDFQKKYLASLHEEEKEELANHADQINSFKEFMSKKGVILTNDNFKYQQTVGIIATYPDIISHLHFSLHADKEGLFVFNNLLQNFERRSFVNGYLYGNNFMLMAHSYFRRGLHDINNYAPRFVEFFWNLDDSKIEKYISLDPNRVRINVDNKTCIELDTWFGAKFNQNIQEVTNGIVKVKPPADLRESLVSFFFRDAYSLDIKWTIKENIKSFQAEEFKTEAIKITKNGMEYYPVRYVHAEYDIDKGYFRHFDGAIHFYTEAEYYARRDADFNYNSKEPTHIKTLSQKLFKMNGIVTVDTWIQFTSHFLTGNPLIFEYFEGKYPKHITDMIQKFRQSIQDK